MLAPSISFLHAADLHLDSPFSGLSHVPDAIFSEIKDSTFRAFDTLIETAIEKNVDFVLFVGDIFDEANRSVRAQIYFKDGCERLKEHGINVYLSYGNHDFVHDALDVISYPDNVYLFPDETVRFFPYYKDGRLLAHIYGFSYESRAVTENKVVQYEINDASVPFHLAMLHGSMYGNKHHSPYAPFRLNELRKCAFDYWALGHIHERNQLATNPPIIYPGNIQGRHRHETGEKGCYYVQLSKSEQTLQFIPLQSILFQDLTIDVTDSNSIYDIEKRVEQELSRFVLKTLVHVTFVSETDTILSYEETGALHDLIQVINERNTNASDWIYLYTYKIDVQEEISFQRDDLFVGEMLQTLEEIRVEEALSDLYYHPLGRQFLRQLPDETIKKDVKQLLLYELLRSKEGDS